MERTDRKLIRGRLMLVLATTVVTGCVASAPPTPASAPPTAAATPTSAPVATATPTPTPLAATQAPPAASPSPQAAVDWPPVPEDDIAELPPIARLILADGMVLAGKLGSFSYRENSGDSPWISGGLEPLTASQGEQLTVGLLPGHAFSEWSVNYAAADDETAEVILPLAAGSGEDLERASFAAPPEGEWVVQVMLRFPGDDGDATYYWRVDVR